MTDLRGGLSDDQEFVFATKPDDPEMRESVNAWIWDQGEEVGFPRIGVEAVAEKWDTHDVQVNIAFADGRVLRILGSQPSHSPFGSDGRPTILGSGPLSFEVVDPYRKLSLRLRGEATQTTVEAQLGGALIDEGDRVPVELDIDFEPAAPPWVNGSLLPEAKEVLETQEEGYLMGHPWRFEQLCRAIGELNVDGVTYEINGGANRVRRQSVRREAELRGHVWQAALFPSGKGFSYIAYPERSDGLRTYNEGYIFEGSGPLVPARVVDAPWLRSLVARAEEVPCMLETAAETIRIEGQTVLPTFMIMPPEVGGGLQLNQAIVKYTWDGEEANGMMERSTVPFARA